MTTRMKLGLPEQRRADFVAAEREAPDERRTARAEAEWRSVGALGVAPQVVADDWARPLNTSAVTAAIGYRGKVPSQLTNACFRPVAASCGERQ
jgi:hypothetical protein